jgi:hypothetical protein
MMNVVRLICPNLKCRKILSVPESARGKKVRCRGCGMRVQIPEKEVAPMPPAPTAPTPEDEAAA